MSAKYQNIISSFPQTKLKGGVHSNFNLNKAWCRESATVVNHSIQQPGSDLPHCMWCVHNVVFCDLNDEIAFNFSVPVLHP